MAKIFITGGAGYIGSRFAKEAVKAGHQVHIFDSLIYEQDALGLQSEIGLFTIEFTIGDTRNTQLLGSAMKAFAPDFVLHLAELSGVQACNHNPKHAEAINVTASINVLRICELLKVPVIYNSSSSVYGAQEGKGPRTEESSLPAPTDHYVGNKLRVEKYIKAHPGLKAIVFRPATVFGLAPRIRLDLLPNHFTYTAVALKKIKVFQPNAYRAGIDVEELVQAYLKVIARGKWKHRIYNIGSMNLTKEGFAQGIKDVVPCKIEQTKADDKRDLQIDCARFCEEFNWKPKKPYTKSVLEISDWIRKNLKEMQQSGFAGMLTMPLAEWDKIST